MAEPASIGNHCGRGAWETFSLSSHLCRVRLLLLPSRCLGHGHRLHFSSSPPPCSGHHSSSLYLTAFKGQELALLLPCPIKSVNHCRASLVIPPPRLSNPLPDLSELFSLRFLAFLASFPQFRLSLQACIKFDQKGAEFLLCFCFSSL